MTIVFEPVEVQSLKEACMAQLEGLILAGEFRLGERLPAERDLAERLNVSRPVVHEALVEMAAKGLVSIQPRRGVYVNDFRTSGSCAVLSSLLEYADGKFSEELTSSMLALRRLLECETSRLAADHAAPEQLAELENLVKTEIESDQADIQYLVDLDFDFHLKLAIASGNLVYPLVINSFKKVYTSLTRRFFNHNDRAVIDQVYEFHHLLLETLKVKDGDRAARIMSQMLDHGARHLETREDK